MIRELLSGSRRFNEFRKGLLRMSPSLLSTRLMELEEAGVIRRERTPDGRYRKYDPTRAGEELLPLVEQLRVWGKRWARSEILPDDLDAGLLMRDVQRRIDRDALPPGRVVVQVHFEDAPEGESDYWLVIHRGDVELCLRDRGHAVDLRVETDVRALTEVWAGELPLAEALRSGSLRLHGPAHLRRSFPRWLELSLFAGVTRPA